jgi:DNA-binding response OmpR family regulator
MTLQMALVVEEDENQRQILCALLEGQGYQVEVAVDTAQAQSLMQTTSFDMIVSEVEIPQLSRSARKSPALKLLG